jgi:hypothetical protein
MTMTMMMTMLALFLEAVIDLALCALVAVFIPWTIGIQKGQD